MTTAWKAGFWAFLVALALGSSPAEADLIFTFASDTLEGDDYGYQFTISETSAPLVYHAVLTNTSESGSGAKIHRFAFNMDALLGTDFTIENVIPSWQISVPNGNGVQFDYLGNADPPGSTNKLFSGDTLSFDFRFVSGFLPSFDLWTSTPSSRGTGIGDGNSFGQVAMHFQALGANDESDLLTSNWSRTTTEPSTLVLLGTGLLGIATLLRRRRNH